MTEPTTTRSVVSSDAGGGHAERVVAAALRELVEGESFVVAELRPDGLDEELVRRERGRVRPEEQLVCRDLATPTRARPRSPTRRQATSASGSSRGGVGVCDRAADGAAVPRDGVADVGEHGREHRMCVEPRVGLADGRADP